MVPRYAVICVEILIGLVGFTILLAGLAFWRLTSGPVSLDFLSPEIEAALSDPGVEVEIGTTQLAWEGDRQTLDLHARNVYVRDDKGQVLAVLPDVVLRLSLRALVQGTIAPTLVEIFDARLRVLRRADGTYQFGPWQEEAGAADQTADPDAAGAVPEGDLSNLVPGIIDELLEPPNPDDPLSFLEVVRVAGGRVVVQDHNLGTRWTAPYADIEIRRDPGGLVGELALKLDLDGRTTSVFALLNYAAATQEIDLNARFSDLVPQAIVSLAPGMPAVGGLTMPLAGSILATLGASGALRTLDFKIRGGAGQFQHGELFAEPVPVRELRASGSVDAGARRMALESAVFDLGSEAAPGPRLSLSGSMTSAEEGFRGDLEVEATLDAEDIAMAELAAYWPAALAPNPRDWVLMNIPKGTTTHAGLSAGLTAPDGDFSEAVLHELNGRLDYTDLEVHYLRPMPPVAGVSGTADFDDDRITFRPAGGHLGDLKVESTTVEITGLRPAKEIMAIDLPVVGPLPDVLRLLDHDRLKLVRKLDLDPADFSGAVAARVHFDFPLLKDLAFEDMTVKALANLEQVAAKGLAMGQDVTDGSLKLALDGEGMQVTGPLVFVGAPMEVSWSESFTPDDPVRTRLEVQAQRFDARARAALGLSLAPYVAGPLAAHVIVRQDRGETTLVDASLDLHDSQLELPPVPWQKPAGTPATAELALVLEDGRLSRIRDLKVEAGTLQAKGRAEFDPSGEGFKRLEFARLTIDQTNLSGVEIDLAGPEVGLRLAGGVLDATPWLAEASETRKQMAADGPVPLLSGEQESAPPAEEDAPRPFRLSARGLEAVIFGPERYLQGVDIELQRSSRGWEKIQLHGTVPESLWHAEKGTSGADLSGETPKTLLFDYGPKKEGGKNLLVTSPDMGAALRAVNALDTVNGGRLEIVGTSDGPIPDAELKGRIEGHDYVLVGAPILGRLLAVASLTGAKNLLGGEGINFKRLVGEFTLQDGVLHSDLMRAYGNALGLTAKGEVDFDQDAADFEGTIVPAYTVNSILGEIPLLGPLLTGGKGEGIFAATYQAKGPLDDLDIKINPLSALAPGFLRSLFSGSSVDGEASALPPRAEP